jgi:hypothetical protein
MTMNIRAGRVLPVLGFLAMSMAIPHSAGATTPPTYSQVKTWVADYKSSHPGHGGKDWDINAKTSKQLASDPAARRLLAICGKSRRPVIPSIAWEYGGSDHRWIKPSASALVYCVYTPVRPSTTNWSYRASSDHVTADVYVLFPAYNPCRNRTGAAQVSACIGDSSNFEILIDIASYEDGASAGLRLANSSSELRLILPNRTKVHLVSKQ